ncbi:MAG: hypothetical protein WCR52_23350, partial [Bacteroidota bacterium]
MKKSDLLALIAADEMRPALEVTQECAVLLERGNLQQDIVLLRSQWEGLEKEMQNGTIAWDSLLQGRNRIKHALLELLHELPEQLPVTRDVSGRARALAPKPGVEEGRFKRQVFKFMLLSKCWIIYWIWLHKSTGGFSSGEATATMSLLLPAFTAYTTVMLSDLIKNRNKPLIPEVFLPRVSSTLYWATWLVMGIYVFAIHSLIGEKAAGLLADNPKANYDSLTAWLGIVESAFGIYVWQIIAAVFKRSD